MSCKGNGDCPLDNKQDDFNKILNEKLEALVNARLNAMLEEKLNAMQGDQNNKKPDSNAVSPQVASPDPKQGESKDESKSKGAWIHAITDIFNNLTKLVPTILNSKRGFPALFGYGGLVVGGTCAILIAYGSNKDGLKMIYNLGLLSIALAFIVFVVWVFWDPDRPGRRKRARDSGKKSQKQQNSDNKIDNSENDDDMKDSLNIFEPIIEHLMVLGAPGSGKSTTFYQMLTREQNEEQSHMKYIWISVMERIGLMDKLSEHFKRLLQEDVMDSAMYDYPPLNQDLQRMYIEKTFSEIIQKDFLFSLSQEIHKVDDMVNSGIVEMFNERYTYATIWSCLLSGRRLYNPPVNEHKFNLLEMNTDKELISLINYRSSSDFNRVNELYSHYLRMFAEQMTSESDLKLSKRREIDINYAIDDSSQLYKEKKKVYPTITHNYLFQIPEIKRLSQNLIVTKESNIPNHKFSFALHANTNQCSTEDEQIQISITNNQKTKSNKLLRKKIKLNLN